MPNLTLVPGSQSGPWSNPSGAVGADGLPAINYLGSGVLRLSGFGQPFAGSWTWNGFVVRLRAGTHLAPPSVKWSPGYQATLAQANMDTAAVSDNAAGDTGTFVRVTAGVEVDP
jgi:hypothetical protein